MPNVFVSVDVATVAARAADRAVVAEEDVFFAMDVVPERTIVFVALRGEDVAAIFVVVCGVEVALLFIAAVRAGSDCFARVDVLPMSARDIIEFESLRVETADERVLICCCCAGVVGERDVLAITVVVSEYVLSFVVRLMLSVLRTAASASAMPIKHAVTKSIIFLILLIYKTMITKIYFYEK